MHLLKKKCNIDFHIQIYNNLGDTVLILREKEIQQQSKKQYVN